MEYQQKGVLRGLAGLKCNVIVQIFLREIAEYRVTV